MAITFAFTDVTTTAANKVIRGDSYTATLTAASGKVLLPSTVSVMMGETDITSTAYNSTTNTITIASVTGDVTITAIASAIITFEDSAVKAICVENWGGEITDEITEYEASLVTSLGDNFKNDTTITKFNELRYFTGLTSLYSSGSGDSVSGQFYNCSALTEITLPAAPISDFRGAFRFTATPNLDLSPTTATSFKIDSILQGSSSGTTAHRVLTLPGGRCTSILRAFKRARGLTTLNIDGVLDLSSVTAFSDMFIDCNALTTITGSITGIKYSIKLAFSPLTIASALVILNGLASGVSSKTVTLRSAMKSTYEADDDFNAAVTTAVANGWTVAYSNS
ncbi:MAG: hypothetical protein J5529_03005 [Prevotella sp.]|nr:hypothetical protein [Prevotella sp.]